MHITINWVTKSSYVYFFFFSSYYILYLRNKIHIQCVPAVWSLKLPFRCGVCGKLKWYLHIYSMRLPPVARLKGMCVCERVCASVCILNLIRALNYLWLCLFVCLPTWASHKCRVAVINIWLFLMLIRLWGCCCSCSCFRTIVWSN